MYSTPSASDDQTLTVVLLGKYVTYFNAKGDHHMEIITHIIYDTIKYTKRNPIEGKHRKYHMAKIGYFSKPTNPKNYTINKKHVLYTPNTHQKPRLQWLVLVLIVSP